MFERRYLVFEDGSYYEGYKLGSIDYQSVKLYLIQR